MTVFYAMNHLGVIRRGHDGSLVRQSHADREVAEHGTRMAFRSEVTDESDRARVAEGSGHVFFYLARDPRRAECANHAIHASHKITVDNGMQVECKGLLSHLASMMIPTGLTFHEISIHLTPEPEHTFVHEGLQYFSERTLPDGRTQELWARTSPDGPVLVEVTHPKKRN